MLVMWKYGCFAFFISTSHWQNWKKDWDCISVILLFTPIFKSFLESISRTGSEMYVNAFKCLFNWLWIKKSNVFRKNTLELHGFVCYFIASSTVDVISLPLLRLFLPPPSSCSQPLSFPFLPVSLNISTFVALFPLDSKSTNRRGTEIKW